MSRNRYTHFAMIFLLAAFFALAGCAEKDELKATATKPDAKVIVIAFDGLDPDLLTGWMDEGVLPNFSKLRNENHFGPLGTSIPPQSPVAWSNFITGQNPGGHGIFDFIHRDKETYLPYLSTSKSHEGADHFDFLGFKIPAVIKTSKYNFPLKSGTTELLRRGRAFWEYLSAAGIDTTVFSIPANYPPVQSNARTISGMGTPDLMGGYGMFAFFAEEPPVPKAGESISGGKVYPVDVDEGTVSAELHGPKNTFRILPKGKRPQDATIGFEVYIDPDADAVVIDIQDQKIALNIGEWSDWTTVDFEMIPVLISVNGMIRFFLKSVRPFALYASPINIDPRKAALPISTPPEYLDELIAARGGKAFHTQGIPEDTKALSNDILTNEEFLQQAWTVLDERMDLYRYELGRFQEGFLFFYFSTSDQLGHMYYRAMDPSHPGYVEEKDAPYKDLLKTVYTKMDIALGEAIEKAGDDTVLMVMSDHGFAPYNKSFHLSSWLLDNGYVILADPTERDSEFLMNVEWFGTKAYSLGINGIYLNLEGREEDGIVQPNQADKILDEIIAKLLLVEDPETGAKVVSAVYKTSEVYSGPHKDEAPDLIVGYSRGYRASWETALGKFPKGDYLTINYDEWSGDHCMAADLVPGSLLTNRPVKLKDAMLYDLPVTILELFGIERPTDMIGRNVFTGK